MDEEVKGFPHSEEAEKALLGCMINGGAREHEIGMAWIRDEDAFYNKECQNIWKAFKEIICQKKKKSDGQKKQSNMTGRNSEELSLLYFKIQTGKLLDMILANRLAD